MIETLMALWNQNRRKRARQILLTFLLMCIGTSLLLVLTNRTAESQHQEAQTRLGQPTIPTFGNTVIPDLTPTVSVVIGTQLTPVATPPKASPVAQKTPVATPQSSPVATSQPTPAATTTQPCVGTPSSAMNNTAFLSTSALRQSPTTTPSGSGTPTHALKHFDGGGGPVVPGTPIVPSPTPSSADTPTSNPPGWMPNCTTSNSIGMITGSNIFTLLQRNIWLILGSSLLGTVVFYGSVFVIRRRIQ